MEKLEMWCKTKEELLAEIHKDYEKGGLNLWRIGQCGYVIKFAGKVLLIDPVLNDLCDENGVSQRLYPSVFSASEIDADYVICTHAHADHLAEPTVKEFAEKANPPVFVVPAGCKNIMERICPKGTKVVYLADKKEELLWGQGDEEIRISGISAAHPEHFIDEDDEHMALSYRLQFGRLSLIHLGDTYLTERLYNDLMAMPSPDVFLPPINGDDLFRKMRNFIGNMGAEEAAKLAVKIGARLAIPTHWDMFNGNTADPQRFVNEMMRLGKGNSCKVPELGERVEL